MKYRAWIMGGAALAIAACNGSGGASERSDAKLSSIDWTEQVSGQTTIGHVDVDYQDAQLKDAVFEENGAPAGRMDFSYQNGKVHTINLTDASGDPASYAWTYAGDRVSSIMFSVPQVVSDEQKMDYDDAAGGRPRRITSTTSWVGAQPSTSIETYDYDDQGRISDMQMVDGSATTTSEVRYDDQSRMDAFTQRVDTTFTENDLTYDDSGRVSVIESSNNDRYEISYDDAGRISEVLYLSPTAGTQLTTTYSYVEGSVSGLTFTPDLPVGGLVDLAGTPFDQPDFTAMPTPLVLGDIPSVTVASCSHDVCTSGGALDSTCDSCATAVCSADSYCCSSTWDSTCVGEVASYCGFTCQ